MKVKVTKAHIERGRLCSADGCAVALALRDAVNADCALDECEMDVGGRTVRTPEDVAVFIARFDRGEKVEPFEFELEDAKP